MRAIIVLAFLGTALAVSRNGHKIIGGTPTHIEKFPFLSNMQYFFFEAVWYHNCGGTLLTSTTILSAAHCYYGDSPAYWRVRLGSEYSSSGGSIFDVVAIEAHPRYNHNTAVNDVAIVRLGAHAQYSPFIEPARIAGPTYILPDYTNVVNVGWGAIDNSHTVPEQLQEVTVQTVNHQLCSQRYAALSNYPAITADMLCAGNLNSGDKDVCEGDFGGPLLHNGDIIIGIVSWFYNCADPYYPSVHSSVAYHSDWISTQGVGF